MPEERLDRWDDGIVAFVIRIRMEGAESEDQSTGWVAHITNVLDQSERYVRDVNDLMNFINEYLMRVGIQPEGPGETHGCA